QRCAPWQAGYSYALGDQIRFEGDYYRARQAHTAHKGTEWQPPRVPALWQPIQQCEPVTPVPGNTDTINGIQVPPDPGAAGRKTLAGIDADNDGVRDDVQRFLAQEVGQHPARFKYAMEMARITQLEILSASGNDREKARALFNKGTLPSKCFSDTFSNSIEDYEWLLKYWKKIDALHSNTPERMAAYRKGDELIGGMMFHFPIRYQCD
ncbi:carbohydrate-binding protein, partial [Chitiniphilus eburneus]